MGRELEWMPMTLFEMASFCEKNKLGESSELLLAAAVALQRSLSQSSEQMSNSNPEAARQV
ncbi:MAG: hypothetical protein ACT4OK_01920 [Gemmobacter sp.]